MAIIRWNPWNINDVLENDWDLPTIPGLSKLVGQGLNIYETEDAINVEAAMPGIPEDNIDVTIDDGIVRVTAHSEEKKEEKDKKKYYMSSISKSYNYNFRLPTGQLSDTEPVCELSDGILHMKFLKVKKAPPKRIKVAKKAKAEIKK